MIGQRVYFIFTMYRCLLTPVESTASRAHASLLALHTAHCERSALLLLRRCAALPGSPCHSRAPPHWPASQLLKSTDLTRTSHFINSHRRLLYLGRPVENCTRCRFVAIQKFPSTHIPRSPRQLDTLQSRYHIRSRVHLPWERFRATVAVTFTDSSRTGSGASRPQSAVPVVLSVLSR
jgi:hypothetical protein